MKRRLSLIIFLTLVFSTMLIAQEKFTLNGMVRPRLQLDTKSFNNDIKMNSFTELRSQVGLKINAFKNVTAFIQLQDSRVFGSEASTLSNEKNIDMHQGYFKIDKFFNLPLYLKVGRMELAYSNQRIIGSVGWHNVGRSFDGGILGLKTKKFDIDFFGMQTNETMFANDSLDYNLYSAYGNLKLVDNYKIHPFVISEMRASDDFSRHTLGLYVAGKHGGLSHEVEAAYQLGTQVTDVDIAAYMFALNLKYTFKSDIKPAIYAGVDYLSGDDGDDASKYKSFNTLYATNHKFYGYMDYFLNIPRDTQNKGLVDIHGKASIAPAKKLSIDLAFHLFNSVADFNLPSGGTSTSFGSEIDLTLGWKYNKAVKFVGGFSMFTPGDVFKEIDFTRTVKGENSSSWVYLMAVVKL